MIAGVNDNDNEWVGRVVVDVYATFTKPVGVDGDGTVLASE
jgi:hypothetical protein